MKAVQPLLLMQGDEWRDCWGSGSCCSCAILEHEDEADMGVLVRKVLERSVGEDANVDRIKVEWDAS